MAQHYQEDEESIYYERDQEYYAPEYEGRYDPERDRFERAKTARPRERRPSEALPRHSYLRSGYEYNPFGREHGRPDPGPGRGRPGPYAGQGPRISRRRPGPERVPWREDDQYLYYERDQEYYGPEREGGYDPDRDRFERFHGEPGHRHEVPHYSYFRSGYAFDPLASEEERERAVGPHTGRGPKGFRRRDERILDEVSERLTVHSWIDANDIEVEVKAGIVTLRGTVDSRTTKRLAEDVAAGVFGVIDVQNDLRVAAVRAGETA